MALDASAGRAGGAAATVPPGGQPLRLGHGLQLHRERRGDGGGVGGELKARRLGGTPAKEALRGAGSPVKETGRASTLPPRWASLNQLPQNARAAESQWGLLAHVGSPLPPLPHPRACQLSPGAGMRVEVVWGQGKEGQEEAWALAPVGDVQQATQGEGSPEPAP